MGRGMVIDITGQTFGQLTVIERVENDKYGRARWKCRCSCGNETIVRGRDLRMGHSKSCGCLRKETTRKTNKNKTKDITNQKFGKLTALYPTDKKYGSNIIWHCVCDCGCEIDVRGNYLTSGTTQSCGCLKSKGEQKINQILQEKNINFKSQYTRDDCRYSKTNRKFLFDFALFDNNDNLLCVIEYNGIQHYECTNQYWNTKEKFEETVQRDKEKYALCEQLNIPLYIIKYDDDIDEKIEEVIGNYNLY